MIELRWIKTFLFLILGLQFTGKIQKSALLQIVLSLITCFSHPHYSYILISVHLSHFSLKFSTAVTGQTPLYITVRDGDEATLSCEDVMTGQDKCDRTDWLFSGSRNQVDLIKRGQIVEDAKVKSDRLSVTAYCSLVIKNVTVEDVGGYSCQQFDRSGQKQGRDSVVFLFVERLMTQ